MGVGNGVAISRSNLPQDFSRKKRGGPGLFFPLGERNSRRGEHRAEEDAVRKGKKKKKKKRRRLVSEVGDGCTDRGGHGGLDRSVTNPCRRLVRLPLQRTDDEGGGSKEVIGYRRAVLRNLVTKIGPGLFPMYVVRIKGSQIASGTRKATDTDTDTDTGLLFSFSFGHVGRT